MFCKALYTVLEVVHIVVYTHTYFYVISINNNSNNKQRRSVMTMFWLNTANLVAYLQLLNLIIIKPQ